MNRLLRPTRGGGLGAPLISQTGSYIIVSSDGTHLTKRFGARAGPWLDFSAIGIHEGKLQ
jgi:hypothetical protein